MLDFVIGMYVCLCFVYIMHCSMLNVNVHHNFDGGSEFWAQRRAAYCKNGASTENISLDNKASVLRGVLLYAFKFSF